MSNHYFLYCEKTGECVEAVAHVGNKSSPRIEANALSAFLVYHQEQASGAPLVMRNVDSLGNDEFGGNDRSLMSSLEDAAEEYESVGSFPGYKSPIMIWTEANYRSLAARLPKVAEWLDEYERAPSGGGWVRRTVDGRII